MERDRHIRIDKNIDEQIIQNCTINKTSYKEEINNILKRGLQSPEVLLGMYEIKDILSQLIKDVKQSRKTLSLCNFMTRQLYADMDFSDCVNQNSSIALNSALKKWREDKYND